MGSGFSSPPSYHDCVQIRRPSSMPCHAGQLRNSDFVYSGQRQTRTRTHVRFPRPLRTSLARPSTSIPTILRTFGREKILAPTRYGGLLGCGWAGFLLFDPSRIWTRSPWPHPSHLFTPHHQGSYGTHACSGVPPPASSCSWMFKLRLHLLQPPLPISHISSSSAPLL